MFSFTAQEKAAILFFLLAVGGGACFSLLQKGHPAFEKFLNHPIQQSLHQKVHINSATQAEWEALPAIGPYRASQIMKAREVRGRFQSVEDVRYVKGIGPYVFNQIKPYLEGD